MAKGRIALSENEFNLAIDYTEKALEKDLTLLNAYKFLGEIFRGGSWQSESIPRSFVDLYTRYNTSFDPESRFLLSTAYAANGNFEEAIDLLDEILERDPAYYEGFTQRGVIYTAMEEYQKAFEDYLEPSNCPKSFEACITLSEANFPLKNQGMPISKQVNVRNWRRMIRNLPTCILYAPSLWKN